MFCVFPGIRWMCLSVHRPHMKEYPPLCTQVEPYLLPLAEEDEDEDKILKFELDTVDGSSSVNRDLNPIEIQCYQLAFFQTNVTTVNPIPIQ
ncbi:uncharacterized protein CDAR_499211 [Caerostris darwini]|uniref:Uncharacterized protein n=1 Tax=Caerostris darwini TaxID=1538125 RepID=A0AAV4PH13_9ARAC|nr:uncharacterized protein CDAR_499211 [Caerostris darwini]